MHIPIEEISEDALRKIIEEFILREGTEYGAEDFSLTDKVSQVLAQLRRGEAVLVFDDKSESIDIVSARKAAQMG